MGMVECSRVAPLPRLSSKGQSKATMRAAGMAAFVAPGSEVGLDDKNSPLESNRKLFCGRLIRVYLRTSLRWYFWPYSSSRFRMEPQ
jgi:hypothetical protein